jgi:argininosuccinate lyase
VRGATFDRARMRAAAEEREGYANATELADWLAMRGVPFREAHGITARLVNRARAEGKRLEELPLAVLREASPLFDESVYRALSVEAALARRAAPGGTAPARVQEALAAAKKRWQDEGKNAPRWGSNPTMSQ